MLFQYFSRFVKIKRRNRRYFLYIILGITVYLIFFTGSYQDNLTKELEIQIKEFKEAESDENVDTSKYLHGYSQFLAQRYAFQAHTFYENAEFKKELNNNMRSKHLRKSDYLIYEYTPFMGSSKYCHLFEQNNNPDIYLKQCPYTNCRFSCDSTRINQADVLLFHEADAKELINKDSNYVHRVLELRNKNRDQIFTLWNDEANYVTEKLDLVKFNWTISYRLDSEVSDCAYGCIYERANQVKVSDEYMAKDFAKRKNHAIWFVSNCNSKRRIKFALDVQKKFSVRIFGACKLLAEWQRWLGFSGDSTLGAIFSGLAVFLGNIFDYGRCGAFRGAGNCEIEEFSEAKFFFSFESKNCSNTYITEKFYRILRHNLIPVLLQPNREFYERIAPPDSFIHAQDFGFDAERLGEYLQKVSVEFHVFNIIF